MTEYEFEKIWRRLIKKLDLAKLKKAKTDEERFKIFKKLFEGSDDQAKNLRKMKGVTKKELYDYALADLGMQKIDPIQKSLKRFGEKRQLRIKKATKEIIAQDQFLASIKFNKIGRRIVKGGTIIKIGKKTYKGGQFLPTEI